jgi:hypothetical protein
MSASDTVLGIIFSLSQKHIERFFEGRGTVFVKFYGRQRVPSRLRRGSKLFFYRSGGRKEIVGEAKIIDIKSGTFDDVWSKFSNRLFLTRDELEKYVGKRKDSQMTVLVLDKIRAYSVPIVLQQPLTMAGQYMTRQMYERLMTTNTQPAYE